MNKDDIYNQMWNKIAAVVAFSPETGTIAHDKQFYLKVFKNAEQNNLNIGCDALMDGIRGRFANEMNETHEKVLSEVGKSWYEWSYLMKHYEKV